MNIAWKANKLINEFDVGFQCQGFIVICGCGIAKKSKKDKKS